MSEYIGVRLTPELKTKVKAFCTDANIDISEFIRIAIQKLLATYSEEPDKHEVLSEDIWLAIAPRLRLSLMRTINAMNAEMRAKILTKTREEEDTIEVEIIDWQYDAFINLGMTHKEIEELVNQLAKKDLEEKYGILSPMDTLKESLAS